MSKFPEFEPDLGSPPDARSAYELEYIAARLAGIEFWLAILTAHARRITAAEPPAR